MHSFIVFLAVVAAVTAGVVYNNAEEKPFASQIISEKLEEPFEEDGLLYSSFYTRLDHARPQNRIPIRFNYVANLNHYREEGPFYIYFKDAFETDNRRIQSGLMVDIAAQTGGALFTFDQRYFGTNNLTTNNSFENLEFLTIEQTLSDVALFIEAIRLAHPSYGSQVIVWGSGYGATLAAWARKRYPHLVDAAWSSSGAFNLEAFTYSQYDLLQFTVYNHGSKLCRNQIAYAFQALHRLVEYHEGEYIQERLNLCSPVNTNSTSEVGFLFESNILAILAYINTRHIAGVQELCADMNRVAGDPLNSFAFWKNYVYGHDLECFDYSYESFIERTSNSDVTSASSRYGTRQWYYLSCTQLGMFPVADEFSWLPERVNIEYHQRKCEDTFGPNYNRAELTPALIHLTSEFGSLDQRISNIIYTNGEIDSWLHNGMLFTTDYNASAIIIPFAAKSIDLASISTLDSQAVVDAKNIIRNFVIDHSFNE